MNPIEVIIRLYEPENDDPYIYSTWSRYAYYSLKIGKEKKDIKQKWFKEKIKEISEILKSGRVHIACLKTDVSFIIGYIVFKDGEMKWICIKNSYRKEIAIEKLLLKSMEGK